MDIFNNALAVGYIFKAIFNFRSFSGHADVMLAVGFEKMKIGSLESMENSDGRTHALERHIDVISSTNGLQPSPLMAQMFANAGREHMEKYGNIIAKSP